MNVAGGGLALVGFLLAQTIDDLGGTVGDILQFGTLPAAAVVAYRVTSRASQDAMEAARTTAETYQEQLVNERSHWATREQVYLNRISELERALRGARDEPEPKKESE